ncbi:MAG: cbb3-type cytochrome c oxidase subunit I, partial [Rhodospirillaceae bacterium]
GVSLPAGLRREVAGWSWIAAGSLAVAGVLALLLVLSRVPATQVLLSSSLQGFFYTAIVTHVILSFVVWFLAVLGALAVLPLADAGAVRLQGLGMPGVWAGALGTVLLAVPAFLGEGEPCLNNYVPIVVHPLYYLGLALVGGGVALPVVRVLANPAALKGSVGFGVGVCGVLYLISLLLIVLAWVLLPAGLDLQTFNERLFWGGGHVLQFVNTALMLTAWVLLAKSAFGEEPVPPALFKLMMASMVVFVLPSPAFYVMYDILSLQHRLAFTDLLWYGLTLPPVVVGAGLVALLWRRRGSIRWGAAELAIGISLAVFLVGGAMGFFLGASDARTPSHYHSAIGGVNLAFMGLFLAVILPALGRAVTARRLVPVTLHFYGWGQMVFSIGMFVAGAAGVPRKTMGAVAQGLDSPLKKVAMGVYGLGGALAVLGGVLFIWLMLTVLLKRKEADHV